MNYEVGLIFVDDEDYSNKAEWCNNNGCYIEEIEPKEDGTGERLEELKASIISSVQQALDSTAQSRGYDNGFALASYSNSTDAIFRHESEAFVVWRDKAWRYCYNLLDMFLAGEIEQPTVEHVLENMPKVEWNI